MTTIKYPICGVALGPGDPELITIKGLKAIQNADVVYYAASRIENERIDSFSKKILDAFETKATKKPLLFPMSGKNRTNFYQQAFEQLKNEREKGLRVVMVTEGDLGFYSTFGYIMKLCKVENIPVEAIAGVPAFIAAGAQSSMPIVDGNRAFINIARPSSFEEIEKALATDNAVAVMKMKVLDGWFSFLKNTEREFIYVEKVGTDDEFITSNYQDLENRKIPYFSLIVFSGVE